MRRFMKDEGRPLEAGFNRERLQTALSCIERKFLVVSVKVKRCGWKRPHQVGIKVDERKRTIREVSKICRDDVKTG